MPIEATTGLSGIVVRDEIIVSYPEGFTASEGGDRSWNARFWCRDAMSANSDDIGFLSGPVDDLAERYSVSGVLVTSLSNGGMLTHLAGIELADKLTAIAPVAATIGQQIAGLRPKGEPRC